MKRININVLKEFNQLYDYNLPEKILNEILNCLKDYRYVSQNEIIDEFEYYAN